MLLRDSVQSVSDKIAAAWRPVEMKTDLQHLSHTTVVPTRPFECRLMRRSVESSQVVTFIESRIWGTTLAHSAVQDASSRRRVIKSQGKEKINQRFGSSQIAGIGGTA
ncbi:hypothetical protein E2C01_043104 [Portunus trituberculatus]|uniref:Uncharacterized protein n=1 Tax=Portunus trituberculatus TaxID=210409 RepID=A0A5B7FUS4_PORTR|nr:hypothetical protein [Portunus trituberculatus]